MNRHYLSVLALSSRFDGPKPKQKKSSDRDFQYSLCRVVLMVMSSTFVFAASAELSVLALSSRFDGRV